MNTNILVHDSATCCGCGGCVTTCPRHAISMAPDDMGCLYPVIEESLCIDCGICLRTCAYGEEIGNTPFAAYAAVSNCDHLVRNSASGGVFATLAKNVMADGGAAAGAVMDCGDDIAAYHILSMNPDQIHRMQGSKYVQSEAWRCYDAVKKALNQGRIVLFSGTPCQVGAVKRITGDPDNLITIDLICHGVPSMQILSDYLKILERRFKGKIRALCFRDKTCGKTFCARIDLKHRRESHRIYLQSRFLSFYQMFLEGSIYRENCYTCPYARGTRISDLTIGDYWGVEKVHANQIAMAEMDPQKNWSCILVNTQKGQRFLDIYGNDLIRIPSRLEWIAQGNRQLNNPTSKPASWAQIREYYHRDGYQTVEKAYIRENGGNIRFFWNMFKNMRRNARNAGRRFE